MSAKIKASIREKYEELDKDKILDDLVDKVIEVEKLKKEKEKLEKELKKYKNAHTPPSKLRFEKPQAKGLPVGRKEGKKSNHAGKTRPQDKPTQTIWVETDKNPITGNTNIVETGEVIEVTTTDFKITKVVTLYKQKEYKDLDTGEIFLAPHKDIPEKGIFGKNMQAFASILHVDNRVTLEGVASIFTNVFGISITAPTAMALCNRTAEKVKPEYTKLNEELKQTNNVNIDETSSNQNGKQNWLWGFFTSSIAFFAFFSKRGGNIIERILGKYYRGIIGCDGWSTYRIFSEIYGILLQRCWAHLIREVKFTCKDRKELHEAYEWIMDIFEKVKKARRLKRESLRKKKYEQLIRELDRWVRVYRSRPAMRQLITKVENGREFWFTCVLHSEIEPTNNAAERGLRKFVVMEKIMGCLRSEQGKETLQVLLSLCGTWRLRSLNPYQELRAIL